MKSCPLCGTEAADEAARCPHCTYKFSLGIAPDGERPPAATLQPRVDARPTGAAPMVVGWLCLAASAILMLISFTVGPSPYDVSYATGLSGNPYASQDIIARVSEGYARQWQFQLASGAFFSLFIAFWSVGYIVHAISFLPGKNDGSP
jgi:hypothetical protein